MPKRNEMKTDHHNNAPAVANNSIWTNDDDLLVDEQCLPVIGSSQVSSILSNLDAATFKIDHDTATAPILMPLENHNLFQQTTNHPAQNSKAEAAVVAASPKHDLKNAGSNLSNIKYFLCQLCPFFCIKNAKITEHIASAHKNKTVRKLPNLKCPACSNAFSHKMSLRSHLIHDHGVGNSDLAQIIQAVVFAANREKAKDQKSKIKGAKVKKPLPSSTSSSPPLSPSPASPPVETSSSDLPKLELSQSSINTLMTSGTQQPAPGLGSLSKMISSKSMHKCTAAGVTCKVHFHNRENMDYHVTLHKDNGFVCLVCNEAFNFWKPLASHLWNVHRIDMELYACDKCDYKSVSLAKLNNIHKLIHGNVKAYVCDVCKKAFKNSKQLGNHKVTHKTDYEKGRFLCETCSKAFSNRRQLSIHMNVVHQKIRPFLCSFCGYKGSSRSSLKMHTRQHTGEKPFACGLCSYTTSDHNSLRRHKLRHTGQKPYKCSYCAYACIQSSTYKVHLKTKHPGQEKDLMFTCNECQFRSVNKEMYISHLVTVHDQKPPS